MNIAEFIREFFEEHGEYPDAYDLETWLDKYEKEFLKELSEQQDRPEPEIPL